MTLPKRFRNISLILGTLIVLAIVICAVFAPYLSTHGIEQMDMLSLIHI